MAAPPDMAGVASAGQGNPASAPAIREISLHVDGMHCGACIAKVEGAIGAMTGVELARANLTQGRVRIRWRDAGADPPAPDGAEGRDAGAHAGDRFIAALRGVGFDASVLVPESLPVRTAAEERDMVRCMAVAGFAAANVMLLSLSIWAGHSQGMAAETRSLFHWFSALIALPALAYAGRPFFRSAVDALRNGRTNMDVPISLAVTLAAGVSLWETIRGGPHAYFDSAIALLFFLLIGRYLDRRARRQAQSAAGRLIALQDARVTVIGEDGKAGRVLAADLAAGMRLAVAAGERLAADGIVRRGRSEVDASLMTGEAAPRQIEPGATVHAGVVNLAAPVEIEVTAAGNGTVLADIVRLTEAAEQRKSAYVVLADRVSRLYAPAVHTLALLAFLGWILLGGMAWQPALLIAIAVLIVTCPCALGLAVPVVQVVATGRLLRIGVLVKSGDALERLAAADTVVFDKTGTLTLGAPTLAGRGAVPADSLALAASLAAASRHPLSRALAQAAPEVAPAVNVAEMPGCGLSLATPEGEIRLGKADWCGVAQETAEAGGAGASGSEFWLTRPGAAPVRFRFEDALRPDAAQTVEALRNAGLRPLLLSGDRPGAVAAVAAAVGIEDWRAGCTPQDKLAALEALRAQGARVLMVGDGLNDAPALAAAHVSVSPSGAADIAQVAADIVFQSRSLGPVAEALTVARRAQGLVRQNIGLAVGYNLFAVPLAVAGLVTPMVAAICMSGSSIVVVLNAVRLAGRTRRARRAAGAVGTETAR
ncbi:MAG: heavy metal translocating P-type ATPase [Rhodospirillaceae bacterium]|nr:heavy metal translocating P-type ATPase [Rhodospirillaceae bacterium]